MTVLEQVLVQEWSFDVVETDPGYKEFYREGVFSVITVLVDEEENKARIMKIDGGENSVHVTVTPYTDQVVLTVIGGWL